MKGIILAGGSGTRLYPLTKVTSKQLLPIYDKPMIYYPLSMLLLADIRDILIITTPKDEALYKDLLGDGSRLGISITYAVQDKPRGLADAFIIGADFIGRDSVCLILGDNIFYGQNMTTILQSAALLTKGAAIFGYPVNNPKEFGVVEFDDSYNVISIEEKPERPKSKYAVPGLYFYDNRVVEIAKNILPSSRGEIEITAINNEYLRNGELKVKLLGRGVAWFDTGTPVGLLNAAQYVETIQSRQGFYISCIEEIAWRKGYINSEKLLELGMELKSTEYGKYLVLLAEESMTT